MPTIFIEKLKRAIPDTRDSLFKNLLELLTPKSVKMYGLVSSLSNQLRSQYTFQLRRARARKRLFVLIRKERE